MAIDPAKARDANRLETFKIAATVVAIDRLGGELVFTEAEFKAVQAKYGGAVTANLRFEVIQEDGQPDRVRARLERKTPKQGDLPV